MNQEYFEQIRANMKKMRVSGVSIAQRFQKSPGWINSILRGNYPYYKGYGLPVYLENYLEQLNLLPHRKEER
jgi:hypothetical protein